MLEYAPDLRIGCRDPHALSQMIMATNVMLIDDPNDLRVRDCKPEGVLVPNVEGYRNVTFKELDDLTAGIDTPGALRLVRVPKDPGALMDILRKNGVIANRSRLGDIILNGTAHDIKFAQPGLPTTTINTDLDALEGLHIDLARPGTDPAAYMMGVVYGGSRGITICPSITLDVVPPDLRQVATPADRAKRRAQIRAAVEERIDNGEQVVCYTIWLPGSGARSRTAMAYVNLQARLFLHDGISVWSLQDSLVSVHNVPVAVPPGTFESIV